ncbi:bifunctional aspartate kinase/homoserine dehydrogenase I [Kangiella geojedonensis]|uniref:Bifunctional aspartokinase/homoserine dehydrogenase n=1 Tax=Kangiella geojedonensis TaxID=914150 RepID=A0A0F6TSA8_9GAMM|nr:bifunctional aspartate kinase/homoserine dehydrogenase I [Kangiella geojedonensis]AKE52759.1 Bifunctional aspartokinase I/homoserine dehydrogenase I [Kangiella geojedonensis]
MKVLKFGGSSLADSAGFLNVANIITARTSRSIITVSATATTTDTLHLFIETEDRFAAKQLLSKLFERHHTLVKELELPQPEFLYQQFERLQHQLNKHWDTHHNDEQKAPHRISEVFSAGEYLSSWILDALIKHQGYSSYWLDSRQAIKANGPALESKADLIASQKAWKSLSLPSNVHFLIAPGFVASDKNGLACLLGRNGSDYSAAIFAHLCDADSLEIWTDVSGIYNADPKIINDAQLIGSISYKEAMELAHHGAGVIHPKTIGPVRQKGIPLIVKNSFAPQEPGTVIAPSCSNDAKVKAVSSQNRVSLLSISGSYLCDTYGAAERIFGCLARHHISIILISQSSSEYSVCIAIRQSDAIVARQALKEEFAHELSQHQIDPIDIRAGRSIVTVVGQGLIHEKGVSSKFLSAISSGGANIEAIAQGSSELSISAVIEDGQLIAAYRRVYAEFFDRKRQVDLFILGCGNVGAELIRQIQTQQPYLNQKGISANIRLIANSKYYCDEISMENEDWRPLLEQSQDILSQDKLKALLRSGHYVNPTIVDCTCSDEVSANYANYLDMGFNLVTANKKANSSDLKSYRNIRQSASRRFRHFFYETNVGAGLPILKTLDSLLCSGDKVHNISGVLSGSLSYILGLVEGGMPMSQAVAQAKEQGFTEPDPRDDLSGMDVARKILILARELGAELELSDIQLESLLPDSFDASGSPDDFILALSEIDAHFAQLFEQAKSEQATLKYVASFEHGQLSVGLQQVSSEHPLYSIKGGENAIAVYSDYYSPIPFVIKGYGAGASVTASGIFSDILQTLPHREQELAS